MQIVCLDGYTLNPGDLSWEAFQAMGSFTSYDRTGQDQIIPRAKGAAAVLTNKTVLDAQTLTQLPDLRYIGVLATGYNVVDVQAAAAQGVTVTHVPAYSTHSVAQHAAAMLLQLACRIDEHNRAVHEGQWSCCPDFSFTTGRTVELAGKTLGLVGLGRIGLAFGHIASAMGMRLLAHTRSVKSPEQLQGLDLEQVTLDHLLKTSDVVSLHCPLTPETKHLINASRLAQMKPCAWLINTGRGPLVDAHAVAQALTQERLGAAALDVLDREPPPTDDPLLKAPRCLITPHIAWSTHEARQRLMQRAADNLHAFLNDKPINVISPNPAGI